jgi:hypothetical protein
VRFILFGSLKNYLNLSGFPEAFISTYQTKIPPPFVASSLYRGSCLLYTTGRGLPFESVHRTILGSLSLLGLVILGSVHITKSRDIWNNYSPSFMVEVTVLEDPIYLE